MNDLLIYDRNFNALALLDTYNSLIWTERQYSYGDFELELMPSVENLQYLKRNNYIFKTDAVDKEDPEDIRRHVMIIEGLEILADPEEGNTLRVTGRSLESILDRRIVWKQTEFNGKLQSAVERLLNENIISPVDSARKISNFIFEKNNDIAITSLSLQAQYTGDNLYDVISSICEDNHVGFKITLNDADQFCFKLYSGVDHSYGQTDNPYICFSPEFQNIVNSNYKANNQELKNITKIGGEGEGTERRFATYFNTATEPSGLSRKELFSDARNLSSDCDNMYDPENPNLKDLSINITTKKFESNSTYKLLCAEINPGDEYTVNRANDLHMIVATCPVLPEEGGAITDYVEGTSKATIVAGDNDTYIAIQLATVDDGQLTVATARTDLLIESPNNQFNASSMHKLSLNIDTKNKKYTTYSEPNAIYIPIQPGGKFSVSRQGQYHLRLATSAAVPAKGGKISVAVDKGSSSSSIEATASDKYLMVQLFTEEDIPLQYSATKRYYLNDICWYDADIPYYSSTTRYKVDDRVYRKPEDIPEYSASSKYSNGSITYRLESGVKVFYKCIEYISEAEPWTPAHWEVYTFTNSKVYYKCRSDMESAGPFDVSKWTEISAVYKCIKATKSAGAWLPSKWEAVENYVLPTFDTAVKDLNINGSILMSAATIGTLNNIQLDPETMKFVSASTNRTLYYEIEPETEYKVTRKYSYSLLLGTSKDRVTAPVDLPVVGDPITNIEDGTTNASITSGKDDWCLTIQLFSDDDMEPTNVENGLAELTIKGPMLERDYISALKNKGAEDLLECTDKVEFEAEMETTQQYMLGRDFFIGDKVQIVNEYGIEGVAMITEVVYSADTSGYKYYPAFTIIDSSEMEE